MGNLVGWRFLCTRTEPKYTQNKSVEALKMSNIMGTKKIHICNLGSKWYGTLTKFRFTSLHSCIKSKEQMK